MERLGSRGALGGLLGALVLLASGCADLPPLGAGVCGNGVVEPSAGEDCDGQSALAGTQCAACRYVCSASGPSCPDGMGCGSDGVCRAASGSFEVATRLDSRASELFIADLDGDGMNDLIRSASESHGFDYFAGSLVPSLSVEHDAGKSTGANAAVAELSGDSHADVVLPFYQALPGLVIALGNERRDYILTGHPSLPLPSGEFTGVHVIMTEVLPQTHGDEIVLMGAFRGTNGLAILGGPSTIDVLAVLPFGTPDLTSPVLTVQLDERPESPCHELVFAFRDEPVLYRYTPCRMAADGSIETNALGFSLRLALPTGATVFGPVAALDANFDGHADLVVSGQEAGVQGLYLTYGVGDGSFNDDSASLPANQGNNLLARLTTISAVDPVLAIGDLNGDGVPDYVDAKTVQESAGAKSPLSYYETADAGDDSWSSALIVDMNGNGLPDVIAARPERDVSFMNNVGAGFLALHELVTDGAISQMVAGDCDGDLLTDVAAAQGSDDFGDSFSMFWANAVGAPDPPVRLGQLGSIQQIAGGRFQGPRSVDGTSDMTTVSADSNGEVAFTAFGGRTDRGLRAPYVFSETVITGSAVSLSGYAPHQLALGDFDGDGHLDLGALGESFKETREWIGPMIDPATILTAQVGGSEVLAGNVDWATALLVAADLDGDGSDELVNFSRLTDQDLGAVVVGRSTLGDDGKRRLVLDEPRTLDESFGSDAPGLGLSSRILASDLDGDGIEEILVVARQRTGEARRGVLAIFWGDGSGQLALPQMVALDDLDLKAFSVTSVAPSRIELLALGVDRILRLALEPSSRTFTALGSTPLDEPAHAIAAGDLDGDGVVDLCVAGDEHVTILGGVPVRR